MTGKSGAGKKYIVRIADKAAGTDSRKRFCISESFGVLKEKEIPHYRRRLGIMSPEIGDAQ